MQTVSMYEGHNLTVARPSKLLSFLHSFLVTQNYKWMAYIFLRLLASSRQCVVVSMARQFPMKSYRAKP
jgi:hypothetical protein